jgi:Glycosyltransferase family 87
MKKSGLLLLIAVLAAASMWFYVDRVLVAYQVNDAAAHERPRGNLSDLYPRWLGARELLLHHRNPYGEDIKKEIQQGYYGRALDASRPNDPKDEQGFAYPVYVVFVLAPTVAFPFPAVREFFHGLLIVLTAASVWWWLRAIRWRLTPPEMAICIALTLGCFPAVQGIKLQQLSLLVAALMAGTVALVGSRRLLAAGVMLALGTIKPQLAWPLVAWLLLWAVSDWKHRQRFVWGFGGTMLLLLGGAEFVLPGWIRMFAGAIDQYHRYTQNHSILDELLPGTYTGKIVGACAVVVTFTLVWIRRRNSADSIEFGEATALVTALTVLVVPMYAPYNQLLLLPAILLLARDQKFFRAGSKALRFTYRIAALALAWQWIASLSLSAMTLAGLQRWAFKAWWLPGLATFALPLLLFLLIFLDLRNVHSRATHYVVVDQQQAK